MAPFTSELRRRVVNSGYHMADQIFGLRWSGQMTKARLLHLIGRLPTGLSEIYLHPATGSFFGHAKGYRYESELAALIHPDVIAACRNAPLTMGGYADFSGCMPRSVDGSIDALKAGEYSSWTA
jgi:hypothetical protein